VEQGFAKSYWCGDAKCEEQIKETTKATLRCIPLEQPGGLAPPETCTSMSIIP
jgi:prolyl-tRNA synthetase